MAETNRPYDLRHHYYMYDIGWLIDKIQAVSDELGQAIDLRTIHYADPINWDITTQYQANTVVVDNKTGVAYISSKNVPAGVLLTNTEYWNPIFNYNDAINKLMSTIAYNEQDSPTATAAHAKGSFIYSNAVLYQAIKDIADGDALKVGANIQLAVLSDSINTAIEAVLSAAREAIAAEATARSEADDALSKRIDAEAAARADADANYTGTNRASTVTGNDTRTAGDITDTADNVVIHGKKSILMDSDGTYTEDITGKKKVTADSAEETYQSTRSIHVVGAQTEAVDSDATKSVGGTYSKTVTGVTTETYNAARAITGTNSTESYTGKKVISAQDIQFTPGSGAITYSKPSKTGDLITIPFKDSDGEVYKVLCEGTKIKTPTAIINVQEYGAKGDGITDDSAAINAAVTAAKAKGGGIVFLPSTEKGYFVHSTINVNGNVYIRGDGQTWIHSDADNVFTCTAFYGGIADICIVQQNPSGNGIYFHTAIGVVWQWRLEHLQFQNCVHAIYDDANANDKYVVDITAVDIYCLYTKGVQIQINHSRGFMTWRNCKVDHTYNTTHAPYAGFVFTDVIGLELEECDVVGPTSARVPIAYQARQIGFSITGTTEGKASIWLTRVVVDVSEGYGIYIDNISYINGNYIESFGNLAGGLEIRNCEDIILTNLFFRQSQQPERVDAAAVSFYNCKNAVITNIDIDSYTGTGFGMTKCNRFSVNNVCVRNCRIGIYADPTSTKCLVSNGNVWNNTTGQCLLEGTTNTKANINED